MDLTNLLSHSVSRIVCEKLDSTTTTGSGFFYFFRSGGEVYPFFITNKHVIKDAVRVTIWLNRRDNDGMKKHRDFVPHNFIGIEENKIEHPDPNVDLAGFNIGSALKAADDSGHPYYIQPIEENLLATNQMRESCQAMQSIITIGYPNGIWDKVNNNPIFRKGVTATPIYMDYEGENKFLIDCAIFPGASGSPVFVYESGLVFDKVKNSFSPGQKVFLAGIVYGVMIHSLEGDVVIREVPTQSEVRAISGMPNNIGVCLGASEILALKSVMRARGAAID